MPGTPRRRCAALSRLAAPASRYLVASPHPHLRTLALALPPSTPALALALAPSLWPWPLPSGLGPHCLNRRLRSTGGCTCPDALRRLWLGPWLGGGGAASATLRLPTDSLRASARSTLRAVLAAPQRIAPGLLGRALQAPGCATHSGGAAAPLGDRRGAADVADSAALSTQEHGIYRHVYYSNTCIPYAPRYTKAASRTSPQTASLRTTPRAPSSCSVARAAAARRCSGGTSGQPAAQCVQPAAPCVQPAAPCVQPAAPCVQPAAPCVQPAAPCVQPAAPCVQAAAPCVQAQRQHLDAHTEGPCPNKPVACPLAALGCEAIDLTQACNLQPATYSPQPAARSPQPAARSLQLVACNHTWNMCRSPVQAR